MAVKIIDLPDIGKVYLNKRRGSKSFKLSISVEGNTRVTLPTWSSYKVAIKFVRSNAGWINNHKSVPQLLTQGMLIGRSYLLKFVEAGNAKTRSTLKSNLAIVYLPTGVSPEDVVAQEAALRISKKALKIEAESFLPKRISVLAELHKLNFRNLKIRHLKSRWGSCSVNKDITLNYYLMQLPDELIDYVILHELVHTVHLNHTKEFWSALSKLTKDQSRLKKELKTHKPYIYVVQNSDRG